MPDLTVGTLCIRKCAWGCVQLCVRAFLFLLTIGQAVKGVLPSLHSKKERLQREQKTEKGRFYISKGFSIIVEEFVQIQNAVLCHSNSLGETIQLSSV